MELKAEIQEDMERAEKALQSAERNDLESDFFTAANRIFVACESTVCAFLKYRYGSSSVSRERILTRLKELDESIKVIYDKSYDLRVQADYGKQSRLLPLTPENVALVIAEVAKLIDKVKTTISEEATARKNK